MLTALCFAGAGAIGVVVGFLTSLSVSGKFVLDCGPRPLLAEELEKTRQELRAANMKLDERGSRIETLFDENVEMSVMLNSIREILDPEDAEDDD